MKLFLLVYMLGKVGGVAGPVPYDMAECERRADLMRVQIKAAIDAGHGKNGAPITDAVRSIRIVCVYLNKRPVLDGKVSP